MTLCEDVMKDSYVIEDTEKISFIRSRLLNQGPSILCKVEHLTELTLAQIEKSIQNIFKIFGDGVRQSFVKQVCHFIDKLQEKASTCPIWDGLVGANQLAMDSIKSLEVRRKKT